MAEVAGWAIGLAWTLAGGLGWARLRRHRSGPAILLLALGLGLGAAAALHWHAAVYQLAREQLRSAGIYDHRLWLKLLLGVIAVAVAAALLVGHRRWLAPLPPALHLTTAVMVAWAIFLFAFTCGLDDLLPDAFANWPGRQLLEAAVAATALLAVSLHRQPHVRAR